MAMEEEGGAAAADASKAGGRREKRKALKKLKRKKCRRQIAEAERIQQELRLADPEEQIRILKEQQLEAEREELERKEFEENERLWLQREQQAKDDFERKQQEKKNEPPPTEEEEDGDYVDGPPEIIWEGNQITIKKQRVKVIKEADKAKEKKDKPTEKDRPTHNPPPPRSAFQLALNTVNHDPNYGTEQDKTHCPFHVKTGVCRFGTRCSRVHVYPEKSCTLLIKNMYTGPGLAWEHDEALEYTDEEVAEQFEEFYEDVHSEFLKFGELVNFKVCRNSSSHLRGNVYIHYRSEDSAVSASLALTGRFYAGKQMIPEFVGVTKWKAALCGDYLKAHYGACSRGASCNFLHCFRNPGGEYDWADRDALPPRVWQQKMAILFGHQPDYEYHTRSERDDPRRINTDEHRERKTDRESHCGDHYERKRDREYEDGHHRRKSGRNKHKHEEDRHKKNDRHSRRKRPGSDDEQEIRRHKRSTREEHSDDSNERDRHKKRSKRSSHWDDQSDSSRRKHHHRSNSISTTINVKDRWQGGS